MSPEEFFSFRSFVLPWPCRSTTRALLALYARTQEVRPKGTSLEKQRFSRIPPRSSSPPDCPLRHPPSYKRRALRFLLGFSAVSFPLLFCLPPSFPPLFCLQCKRKVLLLETKFRVFSRTLLPSPLTNPRPRYLSKKGPSLFLPPPLALLLHLADYTYERTPSTPFPTKHWLGALHSGFAHTSFSPHNVARNQASCISFLIISHSLGRHPLPNLPYLSLPTPSVTSPLRVCMRRTAHIAPFRHSTAVSASPVFLLSLPPCASYSLIVPPHSTPSLGRI